MRKTLILALLALASTQSLAARETTSGHIDRMVTYPDFGSGNTIVELSNRGNTCYGYWIETGSKGHDAALSALLGAFHSKKVVSIVGLDDSASKWNGSPGRHYCKLYAVDVKQ
ncbi:hypothetical protein [Pseudoalteromonas ardens]|uniref:Uncharacterized protein n=1 Tax=Pseudoalteromonas rubra TaxID=43658 RepID=A0A0L0ERF3_9GAMM|nr:hypothetical protein [Pseudoalteromonas sp. R96]KNC66945.1 hypothetical protein AC626_13965 [Pseudoalteromonas rubra]MDK1313716.1 hypothetical protein [Pseudoalteromonas sp. R96]